MVDSIYLIVVSLLLSFVMDVRSGYRGLRTICGSLRTIWAGIRHVQEGQMVLLCSDREHHMGLLALPHGHNHKTGDMRIARGHSILRIEWGFSPLPTPVSHRSTKRRECASLVFSGHATFSTPKAFHVPSRAGRTLRWMLLPRELSSGAPQQGTEEAGALWTPSVVFQFLFDFLLLCMFPWGHLSLARVCSLGGSPVGLLLPTSQVPEMKQSLGFDTKGLYHWAISPVH